MKSKTCFSLGLAAVLLAYTAQVSPLPFSQAQAQTAPVKGQTLLDWSQGMVKVTGSGAPPQTGSAAQKRLMAKRAAIADGYRQLGELLSGVKVDSETLVKNYVTESDVIRTQVSALIKGAQFKDVRYMSDGSVEIDVVINFYGENSLSAIMQPVIFEKKQIPTQAVPLDTPVADPQSERYTGLIVDCLGLGMEPAMSPSIKDENGKEIYIGKRPIDPDQVVNIGIVGYNTVLRDAQNNGRVGANPLIVKALRSDGKHSVNAIVSASHAQAIEKADDLTHFLSSSKVVFLIDPLK